MILYLNADLAEYLKTIPRTTTIAVNLIKNPQYFEKYQIKISKEEAQKIAEILGAKKEENLEELASRISSNNDENAALIKVALGLRDTPQDEREEIINALLLPGTEYWGLIYYLKKTSKDEKPIIIEGIKRFIERDKATDVLGMFCVLSQVPKKERQEILDLSFDLTQKHPKAYLISIMLTLKDTDQKDRATLAQKMSTILSAPLNQELPKEPELTKIRDTIKDKLQKYYTFNNKIPDDALSIFFNHLALALKLLHT